MASQRHVIAVQGLQGDCREDAQALLVRERADQRGRRSDRPGGGCLRDSRTVADWPGSRRLAVTARDEH